MNKIVLGIVAGLLLAASSAEAALRPLSAGGLAEYVALKPDLSIGIEAGDESLMFGSITRIDLDGQGNIYVLDYKFRKIVVYSPEGRLIRTISVPEGQGPKEAANLGGIAVTPSGTLFVNDMMKVIVYDPDGQFVRSFRLDFMITSIGCPGTEDLVAIGPNDGKILHVFDKMGKHLNSFGDVFAVPAELESMKGMPMFGAPILFNCAKDGRIYVINPHRYEVSVFKDGLVENVLKGENPVFKPVQQAGRAFLSTAASIVRSGRWTFVLFRNRDASAPKTADIFEDGKQVGTALFPGEPFVVDPQGRIWFSEEEDFPKIVRYEVTRTQT